MIGNTRYCRRIARRETNVAEVWLDLLLIVLIGERERGKGNCANELRMNGGMHACR